MNLLDLLDLLMRWLHITGAIVAGGGSIFALFALLPAMLSLQDEVRSDLHERIRRRFVVMFMASVVALLVSGFYNYLRNEIPSHQGQGLYHGLMGLKILLAFAVFFLGSALTGRAPAFAGIRAKRKRWLGVNIFLVLVIVALAGILRSIPDTAGG